MGDVFVNFVGIHDKKRSFNRSEKIICLSKNARALHFRRNRNTRKVFFLNTRYKHIHKNTSLFLTDCACLYEPGKFQHGVNTLCMSSLHERSSQDCSADAEVAELDSDSLKRPHTVVGTKGQQSQKIRPYFQKNAIISIIRPYFMNTVFNLYTFKNK